MKVYKQAFAAAMRLPTSRKPTGECPTRPPPRASAVILAGGAGTRIRHLYPDLPKPMIPVDGKPFLHWQIEWLRSQGIRQVVISAGYRAERIAAYFDPQPVPDVAVTTVAEKTPLGTGGAVRFVVQQSTVASPWLFICNGDTLCPARLADMEEHGGAGTCVAKILVAPVDNVADYGTIETDDDDGITAFVEKGRASGAGWVNAGVYYVSTAWVRSLPATVPLSMEREVFTALEPSQLKVSRTDKRFLDIGVPDRLARAAEFLRNEVVGPRTSGTHGAIAR